MGNIRATEHGGFICPGTISFGTLRPQDLLRAFADEYERLSPFGERQLVREARMVAEHVDNGDETYTEDGDDAATDTADAASEIINELADRINDLVSPHGFHFGNTEGDGTDFGIWERDTNDE